MQQIHTLLLLKENENGHLLMQSDHYFDLSSIIFWAFNGMESMYHPKCTISFSFDWSPQKAKT